MRGRSIVLRSGTKGDDILTMSASNDFEHQHWCYALDIALARLRSEDSKVW